MNFSNYIVYVDESGDHSLSSVNKDFPIFVLAFCIFEKAMYSQSAVLKPEQKNRAFEVLKEKFHKNGSGRIEGVGLKIFP